MLRFFFFVFRRGWWSVVDATHTLPFVFWGGLINFFNIVLFLRCHACQDGLVYSEAPGANGFKTITSASPENLLERATFEREQDPDLPFEFVVTHKSYFEDVELMDKLGTLALVCTCALACV